MANENINRNEPDIARHLAEIRHEWRLTQAELARRCRLSRQEINYFETGERQPGIKTLLRIAQALDLPLQNLTARISYGDQVG